MDCFEKEASRLIKATYVKQGLQALQHRKNVLQTLLIHKKLPSVGLDDSLIEFIVRDLSAMDSNNFPSNAGVGEREGRVYSPLVAKRHYNFAHGIGRSGDIAEVQPKAAGSSIMYKLTMSLVAHALEVAGYSAAITKQTPLVLPLATGMSLAMCLLALKKQRPAAEYVIWPRIDQKSCFKCIITAGLRPLVVENKISDVDGSMSTDVEAIQSLVDQLGAEKILCVLSTTSCFAPRQPDLVDEIARLCAGAGIGHVINNAYGVQCPHIAKLVNRATVIGRVDAIVQSTDKNFMVPVGGAIVTSPSASFLQELSSIYPGRASMSPIMDLFMTLLSMGEAGWRDLLSSRLSLLDTFKAELSGWAANYGEEIMPAEKNTISIGISMKKLDERAAGVVGVGAVAPATAGVAAATAPPNPSPDKNICTFFGSMLFQRCVSGCRVVPKSAKVTLIGGHEFISWGSHSSKTPYSYFTAACSIGLTPTEVSAFMERLEKVYTKSLVHTL